MNNKFIRMIRIPHWSKNVFVFVPLIFSKNLPNIHLLTNTTIAFVLFCLVSAVVYIINDIFDAENDRKHPVKSKRPIASGEVSPSAAFLFILILIVPIVLLSFLIDFSFILILIFYFILNLFYSFILKRVVILDILIIAAGFMLRVIGGGLVIDVYISKWLILTTLFVSLYIAVMKRKSEMALDNDGEITRFVLNEYSDELINLITTVSAAGLIICYALYTVSDRTVSNFGTENLIFTSTFVIYGVFRYNYLVGSKGKGENAVDALLTDLPMLINVVLYFISILFFIYVWK